MKRLFNLEIWQVMSLCVVMECRFREVKCRNCKEISSIVQEIGTTLDGLNKHSSEVKTSLAALENKFGDRFKEMENRFAKVEKKLLQMEDLKFRDSQHGAERDERENARSDQACAVESSSGMEDTKQPNKYAYLVAGGYGNDGN